jgi:tripartite-type tricarboxylate transporter receptor subunit TctC
MTLHIKWRPLAALLICCGMAMGVCAQSFPSKPVRMVNPSAPGGTIDQQNRLFAAKLTDLWKQQAIVENRAGSGGVLASEAVSKAAPNGYTLLFISAQQAISAAYYKKLPYDAIKDFTPVTQLTATSFVLAANLKVPASNLRELIALARAQPGKLNYGSSGLGSSLHLGAELFKNLAGVDIVHIPYKSDALTMPALLGDEIQLAILPTLSALNQMKAGKLKGLGVTSVKRSGVAPTMPTLAESGVPEYEFTGWIGVFLPGNAPRDLVHSISADFIKVMAMPDVADRLVSSGSDLVGSSPEAFSERYRADIALYRKIISDAKVPLAE